MSPAEPPRTNRRGLIAAVGVAMTAGCTAVIETTTAEQRVLAVYERGLENRSSASEAWVKGRGAWMERFFRPAEQFWLRADSRYEAARGRFVRARRLAGASRRPAAADHCTEAVGYCTGMRDSAGAHAEAAAAFATGRFSAGEQHLETGFDSYLDAIDFDIPRAAQVAQALDIQPPTEG
jgi:hypothetical protein